MENIIRDELLMKPTETRKTAGLLGAAAADEEVPNGLSLDQ